MSRKKNGNVETDEDGKLRLSLNEFDGAFRAILARMPTVTLNAQAADLKTNPVTPGIGDRVIDAATWHKRWLNSGKNAADDWYEGALRPSRDPIQAALAANEKRKDRLAIAEKAEKWPKKMAKLKKEDVFEGITGTGASGYSGALEAKKDKTLRRITELQPKVKALAQAIDTLSDKTDQDREKRMLAARKGMIAIGQGETPSVSS